MANIVKDPVVTSKYGGNRNLTATSGAKITGWHSGLDIISKCNDDRLFAIADGKVIYLTEDDGTGCKTIVTAHHGVLPFDCTLLVLYAHCSKFNKKVNDVVKKGDVVAYMGDTGKYVTGKHLHTSMYLIPKFTWCDKDGKYFKWDYKTRDKYEINPNDVLKLY